MGADIAIGVSFTPAKPAAPMPTTVDNTMTMSVDTVAVNERMISHVSAKMTTNISGMRVPASDMPVSANALLSIETPVRCICTSGKSDSICAFRSLANATASGTSVRPFSGYCNTTFTAVTPASAVTIWSRSNGSASATSRRSPR